MNAYGQCHRPMYLSLLRAVLVAICGAVACPAITLNQPGYTATLVATLPASQYSDMELDPSGNVYVVRGGINILKVSPTGTISTWSTSGVFDLTLSSSVDGYGSGGGICHCIVAIQSSGALFDPSPGRAGVEYSRTSSRRNTLR